MKIKSLLAVSFVALTATLGAASAEAVKIGVAAEPYPPFAAPDAAAIGLVGKLILSMLFVPKRNWIV